MATMFQSWSVFLALTLLAVQLGNGEKSCVIWSSAGPVVQRGSTFTVYCTFNCRCKGSMYSDHPPKLQKHREINSTTIDLNVVNITMNRTYSCECDCHPAQDPCGLDISAGYPPDRPRNISCIYKIRKNDSGDVVCTWDKGQDTYLWNTSVLLLRAVSGNHTKLYKEYSKGPGLLSSSLTLSRSVQLISVWVQVRNPLGSVESSITNYTLSNIAMPPAPVLGQVKCSSRVCVVHVEQSVKTQHLEIQYRAEHQTWTTYADAHVQMNSSQAWPISTLEPYKLYHFRARSKFSVGLWSEWSTNISSWTEEEAPAKELDVWFAESTSDFKSMRVYWKEAGISISRGRIIEYKINVSGPNLNITTNTSADVRSYTVPVHFSGSCDVTVWARNSKGLSPPARITTRRTKAEPPQDVQAASGNHSITISWRKPETAPLPAEYVLEWYPEGRKLDELRWVRLGKNESHAVISGIRPFECYEGAVYVLYNESSVSHTTFKGVSTLESVPEVGPLVEEEVDRNKVRITWREVPRGQRMGCITHYTIYLENGSGQPTLYSVPATERMHVINDLPPAVYSVWMSASTARGEGRAGQKVKFFIKQETQLFLLLVCIFVFLVALFLVCLCQSSAVKQRFWELFQCLMLDVVPDPANSKWARECTQEKGKMDLQLQLSNSTVTEEEEEPILVDVEELPKQDTCTPTNASSPQLPPPQTSLSPETTTLLYPVTTYIKSFSHDSDSSDHTQTSLDTNTTVDYISSHGLENTDVEDQEEEEDEFTDSHFLPTHGIFMEPLQFGGKLTLDTVKIDCSDFFQNG
ncbi:interleukin-12 receptor subunit beta-2 isoform X2 [Mugil cephalus]|uniref:interleukin-12 receptor subunit beta-2 isoform X2 n=1 Tax=Mugil cephalus TaxID=48193 RepID=UPI001FB73217|nr:interleukin-12 receptor subunit beta-2 isoform X2 [Mugil cephalus]